MILIADSGSTKTEWVLLHDEKKVSQLFTQGINPYFQNENEIEKILLKELIPQLNFKLQTSNFRLFYIGAGTSGRLGILDASECPPTFGVPHGLVIGLIAGGDAAIRKAVEFAEDDEKQGWRDLKKYKISSKDVLIGIAASGSTPYVACALREAGKNKILTGCIVCNKNSVIAEVAEFPIEIIVGPEFVTGSTRMKSGTAQKLVLNMISTSLMIKLGRVKGNKMVDMQLTNNKLISRGTKMIMEELNVNASTAKKLLKKYGSVRKAVSKK